MEQSTRGYQGHRRNQKNEDQLQIVLRLRSGLRHVPCTLTEWTLIISKELGQWGTDYHPNLDLGRAKMSVKTLDRPVENFKIEILPAGGNGNGGTLVMTWEKTQASIPITVLQ